MTKPQQQRQQTQQQPRGCYIAEDFLEADMFVRMLSQKIGTTSPYATTLTGVRNAVVSADHSPPTREQRPTPKISGAIPQACRHLQAFCILHVRHHKLCRPSVWSDIAPLSPLPLPHTASLILYVVHLSPCLVSRLSVSGPVCPVVCESARHCVFGCPHDHCFVYWPLFPSVYLSCLVLSCLALPFRLIICPV